MRRLKKHKRELSLRQKEVCRANSDRMEFLSSLIGRSGQGALKAGRGKGCGWTFPIPSSRWVIVVEIEVGLPPSYDNDERDRIRHDIVERAGNMPIVWRNRWVVPKCECVCDRPTARISAYEMHARKKASDRTIQRTEELRQSICDVVAAVLGEDAVAATRRNEEVDVGKPPLRDWPNIQPPMDDPEPFSTGRGFLLDDDASATDDPWQDDDLPRQAADATGDDMSTETYEAHPLADMLPMMELPRLKELADDIKVNGQIEPIVLYQGKVLDGRCRQKACLIAGVEPIYTDYEGDSPAHFVWGKNIPRRHLTPSQRAAVVLSIKDEIARESRKRIEQGGKIRHQRMERIPEAERGTTRDKLAAMANTNPRYVQDAMRIEKESPALLAKIVAGELNIREAIRKLDGKTPEPKRRTKPGKPSGSRERIGAEMPRTGMLAQVTVAIGSGDADRRQEVLDEIIETVRHAAGYDERRWMIEIIEKYREGDIIVHPGFDVPGLPRKWTPLAEETRVTGCRVSPICVTHVEISPKTIQHEIWEKDIWYALEETLYPGPEENDEERDALTFE